MSVNKVMLMGRLTRDPELKTTQSGIAVCRFSIAVDRYSKNEESKTDFFDITAWRQTADFVSKYFTKGRMIFVEGDIQNNNYTDQNGVKHYSMAINASNVSFCGDKSGAEGTAQYKPSQAAIPQSASPLGDLSDFEEIGSDDAPF